MTDSLVSLGEANALTRQLNPRAFESKLDEWIRGGLPSASFREGSRSANPPEPELDISDSNALQLLKRYRSHLEQMAHHGRKALEIETGVLPALHLTDGELKEMMDRMRRAATEEVSSRAGDCCNCLRPVQRTPADRLVQGRCKKCYEYRQNHDGADRPRALWEQDIERELAR